MAITVINRLTQGVINRHMSQALTFNRKLALGGIGEHSHVADLNFLNASGRIIGMQIELVMVIDPCSRSREAIQTLVIGIDRVVIVTFFDQLIIGIVGDICTSQLNSLVGTIFASLSVDVIA